MRDVHMWDRGVLLAAGGSRRFGGPVAKQLVKIGGEPAVRRAARRALESRLERLVAVTGHQAGAVVSKVIGIGAIENGAEASRLSNRFHLGIEGGFAEKTTVYGVFPIV